MNCALSEAGRRILDAVIEAPVAWRSPGELAERLHWSLEATLDEIAVLDAAGWLEAWELVDGPVVTLSVAATASCGVRLIEVGHEEIPRWVRSGDPEPPTLWATGVFRSEKAATLELVADSRPGAEHAAILAEEAAEQANATDTRALHAADKFPRPTLLIGGGLSPWPGPRQVDTDDCPACRLAHLPVQAYCLLCDRWGYDFQAEPSPSKYKRTRSVRLRPARVKQELQKQQIAREKRRSKRKERRCKQMRRMKTTGAAKSSLWSQADLGRLQLS